MIDCWRRPPGILEQVIKPQFFITGMPKSGSPFLHRLFASDPDNRVPLTWEVVFPMPSPARTTYDSDPRIKKSDRRLGWLRWTYPSVAKAHPLGVGIPQECGTIMGFAFESTVFMDMFWVPSYES